MQTFQLRPSTDRDAGAGAGAASPGEAWIDIEVSDDEGRQWLASQSGLDDGLIRRLIEPTRITYWRRFGQGLFLNVHAAVPGDEDSTDRVDLGIWLEPDRIITLRHGEVAALSKAAAACSTATGPSTSWGLIVFVLSEALSRLERTADALAATIDQLEDIVLSDGDDPPIHRIAELQRRLIYARRFRLPLSNILSFISSQSDGLDDALRDEVDAITHAVAQNREQLSLSIDRASALQGQIRDQLADSMNSATYRFTWVATVFLPLSFLTGLLGINVAGIPGDHNPGAFWLVCGMLFLTALAWGIAVGRVTSPFHGRRGPKAP